MLEREPGVHLQHLARSVDAVHQVHRGHSEPERAGRGQGQLLGTRLGTLQAELAHGGAQGQVEQGARRPAPSGAPGVFV